MQTHAAHAHAQTHANIHTLDGGKLCTRTKTNRSDSLQSACVPQSRTRRGGVECGDMLQQMAHLLLLLIPRPPVEEDTRSPKPSALPEIKDAGHLS